MLLVRWVPAKEHGRHAEKTDQCSRVVTTHVMLLLLQAVIHHMVGAESRVCSCASPCSVLAPLPRDPPYLIASPTLSRPVADKGYAVPNTSESALGAGQGVCELPYGTQQQPLSVMQVVC